MNRALVAAIGILVIATGVAGGVLDGELARGGSAQTAADTTDRDVTVAEVSSVDSDYMAGSDRTRRLELSGESRAGDLTPSWNLDTRIAASEDTMAVTYEAATFENRVGSGLSDERREAVISERLQRIENRISTLRAKERTAVAAYARGETSQENVTAALVRSSAEASAMEATLARLERATDSESNENFADNLQFRLSTFQSPLRERLTAATRSDESAPRISLRATETGYVLGAIDGGTYYREALRYDNRRPSGPKQISSGSDLEARQSRVYDDTNPPGVQRFYKASGAWVGRMVYTYSDTEIQAFFDGGTGDVFFERNSYSVADMERIEAVNATNASVRLIVERTYFNGPVRISVVDADTGDPIDTEVRIANETVGTTGDDGHLWLVEPASPYAVTVTVDGTTLAGTVETT